VFTGIIEEVGVVESFEPRGGGGRIRVRCPKVAEGLGAGASVAVNGVCLTEVERASGMFTADVAPETLKRTNLGDLKAKALVNLERPLTPAGRLDGHIVQGHVDGTGELIALNTVGEGNWWLTIRVPRELEPYLVSKGSVAVDGMSLTVAALDGDVMSITVIPHTYRNTNLRARRPGDRVNIECDILAKYVEKMLGGRREPNLTMDKLRALGY
jgi:riboflavin synthase